MSENLTHRKKKQVEDVLLSPPNVHSSTPKIFLECSGLIIVGRDDSIDSWKLFVNKSRSITFYGPQE